MDPQILSLVEKVSALVVRVEEAAKRMDSHDEEHERLRKDVEALKQDKWKVIGFLAALGMIAKFLF